MTEKKHYPIIEVPTDRQDMDEPLGTKPKFWYWGENDILTLFKQGREGTGENWAEKVVCEIAEILGIPHANYDLARWGGNKGVITPKFFPPEHRLIFGNELLASPKGESDKKYLNEDHNIDIIMRILATDAIAIPNHSGLSKFDKPNEVFLGYLMLDTLVGNTDRHDENWGVLLTENGLELASTFDHASSLGRELSDETRQKRIETKDASYNIEAYAKKANSALFSKSEKLKTLKAFIVASEYAQAAAEIWLGELERVIDQSSIEKILNAIPDEFMTTTSKDFALRLISTNKDRLLKGD